ncbi:MAG: phospholipase D family protein [Phycisphaeraceae bacterium]
MLEPERRQLLRELLRPPAGFRFDRAIGTTYSLDLMALLTMPVAFTMFDGLRRDADAQADPLAMLQAIREHAGRMHLFCQAGHAAVPRQHHPLLAHLEQAIVQVTPASEHGVFHPKLTALRFVGDMSDLPADHPDHEHYEPAVRYRLLCGSRNLTFDRSWDTMLVLEGDVTNRRNALARNEPLSRFFAALPSLAVQPVGAAVREACEVVAHELGCVAFELPDGFEQMTFWPLGIDGSDMWPFPERIDRLMVVSPFVSEGLLRRFTAAHPRQVLVSRPESMDELPAEITGIFESYCLHATAEEPTRVLEADDDASSADADDDGAVGGIEELTGLHAKIYVTDRGGKTHIWTGSANATNAAFSHNVEFLVELRGPRSRFGVDQLVRPNADSRADEAQKRALRFDDLLEPYSPPAEPAPLDESARQAEQLAERARRQLARAGFELHVELAEAEAAPDAEQYRLTLRCRSAAAQPWSPDVTVHARPLTLPRHALRPLDVTALDPTAVFEPISFRAITAFVVFEIEASLGAARHRAAFVLNLPLLGAPADRHQRLLALLLENREQLLRYLLMLLAQDEQDLRGLTKVLDTLAAAQPTAGTGELGLPLLEPMLRALEADPARLDEIARLVEDLSRHEKGRALLPDGFAEMWRPIWEARQELLS